MEYGVECDGKLIAKFFDKSDAELFIEAAQELYDDCEFSVVSLLE